MSPECKALPTVSRVASAAGAMAITSALLLAVGLGFSPGASAQGASRQVASAPAAKAGTVAIAAAAVAVPAQADAASVARGRYLVAISGCNDCHTAGYSETGGKVPQSDWLLGQPVS